MMAPVRPHGLIFSYTGGAQKSLRGNYHFFEIDQNKIGVVINQLNKSGIGEHIYCVLCGRMTTYQKRIVREQFRLDTQLFIDIMTWFVQQSGHSGFKDTSIPEECPQPLLVEDKETNNNTNISVDKMSNQVMKVGHITSHWLKILQRPHLYMGKRFALAMFQCSAPTLLAYGGTYASITDVPIENNRPFAFLFGIGGPTVK
jgi:hypothetical protein